MFKSATGFLWGQPASNEQNDDSKSTSKPHPQGSHSLTDFDDLSLDMTNDKQHHQRHSIISSSPLSYRLKQFPPKGDPITIVLDKDSKFKLSGTSAISFLFPADEHAQSKRRIAKLSRAPFYIESNRNARYVARSDVKKSPDTESDDSDEKIDYSVAAAAQVNVEDLHAYLDSLSLTAEEKKGILSLCEWVKTDKVSIRLSREMWMAELVISYFSSLSPTNPDMFGCWRRWAVYRADHAGVDSALYNVSASKVRAFLDSGVFSIGFDKERRPVWFLNTEHYDDSFGADVITKACTLFAASLHWDLKKNELDLLALRRGICVYANLSHWSINMVSWGTIAAAKKALVAFPFHLVQIYVSNIPTFMYLLKQLAAKVLVPHAMEKVKVLADTNEYFEQDGYAHKHETPLCAGGTLRVSATQWLKDRGFLDLVDAQAKKEDNNDQEELYE